MSPPSLPLPSWCVFPGPPLETGPSKGLGVQREPGLWWTLDMERRCFRRQPSGLGLGKAGGWRRFPIFLLVWKEQRLVFSPEGTS